MNSPDNRASHNEIEVDLKMHDSNENSEQIIIRAASMMPKNPCL